MKKVTDFIVNKRYFILVTFIILSCFSLYLGTKVNINYDIAEYLPNTSETRIGMDIMNEHFDEIKSSSLNIMFKDLDDQDKDQIKQELSQIDNVASVLYENNSDYNKDEYTLYIVNVDDVSNSLTASQVYDDVIKNYDGYTYYLSGSINDDNKPVLHTWIIIFAICCAMIILIIMCDSYIEPFLFLFVIGLAVFMNKGTNIFFDSVSNITDSISAILQMALSMDYSIMLMNRYSQEREKEHDKTKAMKKALYNAFKSISSSSVTTIVGLLALVFMSFTIGRDLGFVLAKGVLFSLVSIFLCLPALILLFDKLITKTRKKSLHLNLDWLGKLSYKFKYPALILFLVLFLGSYFIKDGLGILYTDAETDEIAKHFKENNQIAIIYDNKYEEEIAHYCRNLEDDNVKQVLCYGNTINEKLTYQDLTHKMEELGSSTSIDDYLLKIIYYNYYNKDNSIQLSFDEFITFIENNIYTNSDLSSQLDDNIKANLTKLRNFTSPELINQKRSSNEIADLLGIDNDTVSSLYLLYNSQSVSTKIRLVDFVNFLNKDVLTNSKYASLIDNNNKAMINKMSVFANQTLINNQMTASELSNLFNLDLDSVKSLLLLYYSGNETNTSLSLSNLIVSVDYLKNNTNYLDNIDVSKLTKLTTIAKNENNINVTKMNKQYLTNVFSTIDSNLVNMVYSGANLDENYLMTPQEFVKFTLASFSEYLTDEVKANLTILDLVIDDSITDNKISYTTSEMANLLGQDINSMYSLYALINYSNGYEFKLSPYEFVNLILNNKEMLKSQLNSDTLNTLMLLREVMIGINQDKYYSVNELSNLLGINQTDLRLLYSLYDSIYVNPNLTISIKEFTNFLVTNVINDPNYASNLDNNSITKLRVINDIITGSINNKVYSANEIYNLLSNLTDGLDKNLVELVYIYNGSVNNYDETWSLTVEEFVNYLNDDILLDSRFSSFISDDMKQDIRSAKEMVDDAKSLLVSDNYSRMILNTTLALENDDTFKFIQSIKDDLDSSDKDIYIIGDSPMAYDMSGSFESELNLITILTMLSIFIVVAVTFKSVIVSLILVLIIQCAVFLTMGILSVVGDSVYFIALLIVQSILMGATIDYAIVYTSYYKESRDKMNILDSVKNAYNKSIHTILTSASILIIVTLVVGQFATAIAAKICMTLSKGTLCSLILILFILPPILVVFDKFICKKKTDK